MEWDPDEIFNGGIQEPLTESIRRLLILQNQDIVDRLTMTIRWLAAVEPAKPWPPRQSLDLTEGVPAMASGQAPPRKRGRASARASRTAKAARD